MTYRVTSSGRFIPDDPAAANQTRLTLLQTLTRYCLRESPTDPQAFLAQLSVEVSTALVRIGHPIRFEDAPSRERRLAQPAIQGTPNGRLTTEVPLVLDETALWDEQPVTVVQPARRQGGQPSTGSLRAWAEGYLDRHGGRLVFAEAVAALVAEGRYTDRQVAQAQLGTTLSRMRDVQRVGRGEYELVRETVA